MVGSDLCGLRTVSSELEAMVFFRGICWVSDSARGGPCAGSARRDRMPGAIGPSPRRRAERAALDDVKKVLTACARPRHGRCGWPKWMADWPVPVPSR